MRSDVVLYVIGAALILLTGYVLCNQPSFQPIMGGMLIYSAIVFVLALFGVTSFIFGYSMRPIQKPPVIQSSPFVGSFVELTRVEGIGDTRANKLRAIGIKTVADLSAASAKELAEKLQISPKITNRWIKSARKLLLER